MLSSAAEMQLSPEDPEQPLISNVGSVEPLSETLSLAPVVEAPAGQDKATRTGSTVRMVLARTWPLMERRSPLAVSLPIKTSAFRRWVLAGRTMKRMLCSNPRY